MSIEDIFLWLLLFVNVSVCQLIANSQSHHLGFILFGDHLILWSPFLKKLLSFTSSSFVFHIITYDESINYIKNEAFLNFEGNNNNNNNKLADLHFYTDIPKYREFVNNTILLKNKLRSGHKTLRNGRCCGALYRFYFPMLVSSEVTKYLLALDVDLLVNMDVSNILLYSAQYQQSNTLLSVACGSSQSHLYRIKSNCHQQGKINNCRSDAYCFGGVVVMHLANIQNQLDISWSQFLKKVVTDMIHDYPTTSLRGAEQDIINRIYAQYPLKTISSMNAFWNCQWFNTSCLIIHNSGEKWRIKKKKVKKRYFIF